MAFVARFLGRRLAYWYDVVDHVPGERLVMRSTGGRVVVRVGAERYAEALALPLVRPMHFTDRPMMEWCSSPPQGSG